MSAVLNLIMFKKFVFLGLLLQFSKQPNLLAFQPITQNNHCLVGHAFQRLHARDWFNCIQACQDDPRCISYNYERSAGANGLCELNICGVRRLCDRHSSLISSTGFVFQQIREGKVRVSCYLSQLLLITSIFSSYNFTGNYSRFCVCPFFFWVVCY